MSKFPSKLAEALWYAWGTLSEDDDTGDIDYGNYVLFIVNEPFTVNIQSEDALSYEPFVVPVGNYIMHESVDGFAGVAEYDTEAEARTDFEEARARYEAWLDEGSDPEQVEWTPGCGS